MVSSPTQILKHKSPPPRLGPVRRHSLPSANRTLPSSRAAQRRKGGGDEWRGKWEPLFWTDTCSVSRALGRSVPRRPLHSGVLALWPRAPRQLGLVIQDPALGAAVAPPPPPQEMELLPRLLLLPSCGGGGGGGQAQGGGGGRGLDEVLLPLQVEGAAHAVAEAERRGGAGVAVDRARVEAVRQVAHRIRTLHVRLGSASHGLERKAGCQEAAIQVQLQAQLPTEGVQAEVRGPESRVALQGRQHQLLVLLGWAPVRARHDQQRGGRGEEQQRWGNRLQAPNPRRRVPHVASCRALSEPRGNRALHSGGTERLRALSALAIVRVRIAEPRQLGSGFLTSYSDSCKRARRAQPPIGLPESLKSRRCSSVGAREVLLGSLRWRGGCCEEAQRPGTPLGPGRRATRGSASGDPLRSPPRSRCTSLCAGLSPLGPSARPGNERPQALSRFPASARTEQPRPPFYILDWVSAPPWPPFPPPSWPPFYPRDPAP